MPVNTTPCHDSGIEEELLHGLQKIEGSLWNYVQQAPEQSANAFFMARDALEEPEPTGANHFAQPQMPVYLSIVFFRFCL